MEKISELLTLYSTLSYVCLALAVIFLASAIYFFFRFRIVQIIRQRLGIQKAQKNGGQRNAPSTSELSRSRRVSSMEYQSATSELSRKRQSTSGKMVYQPKMPERVPEVAQETAVLNVQPLFRVVKEVVVIHTNEQL